MIASELYEYSFSETELKALARILCGGASGGIVCDELRSFQRFLRDFLNETMTVEEAMGFFDAD